MEDFCAHSENYMDAVAGIVEIQFCFCVIAFSLSLSVYTAVYLVGHVFAQVHCS